MLERGIISKGDRGSPEDSDDNPPPNNGLNRIDDIISEASNSSDYLKIEEDSSNSTVSYPGKKETSVYFSEANSSYTNSIGFYRTEERRSTKRLELDEDMNVTLVDETCEGDIETECDVASRPLYECFDGYGMHR
jgi:hypothetical protein